MQHSFQTGTVEVQDHQGYRIRLTRTPIDWIAFIALQGQPQTFVLGEERAEAMAKSHRWVERRLNAERD